MSTPPGAAAGRPDAATLALAAAAPPTPSSPASSDSRRASMQVNKEKQGEGTVLAAEGALLGALIGDAAGAALEFKERVTEQQLQAALGMNGGGPFRTAPGQVTDDGELAMALAWGLVEGGGRFDLDAIAAYYFHWVESKPFDIGATTRKAMWVTPQKGQPLSEAMRASARLHCTASQSNGSLMRCVPLAVWGHKLSQAELVQVVRTEVSLTHPSPVIQDTTTAYCLAIAHLIRHPLDRAGAWEAVVAWAAHADRTVKEWLDLAASATDVPFAPQIGWARIAFVHAFRHLRNGSTYLGALTAVLRGGGDTDTNACIAGGLIGAAVGASGIPLGMRIAVLGCNLHSGSQAARPEWLSTAWALPRLLPALIHLAPAALSKEPAGPPRVIVPLPNKISPPPATGVARPPLALHPTVAELKASTDRHSPIGSQRSSSGSQPKSPDPVEVSQLTLYTPPPVRVIPIGQRVVGPNLNYLSFNVPHHTIELYSMATHEIELKNIGTQPLTYLIDLPMSQWRQIDIQPASDVIQPGQSQTVQISLLALSPHHVAIVGRISITGKAGPEKHDPIYLTVYLRAIECVAPDLEIDFSKISGGEYLARGAAGCVCKLQLDGRTVAVKQFTGVAQLEGQSATEVVSEFYREIKILSQLKHPNIVKFIAASSKFPNLALVMEFAPHGSLGTLLLKQDVVIDWKLRLKFATDIAKGLQYLHLNRVWHRDLKSHNILIMSLNSSESIVSAVVTDFNASKFGERTKAHDAAAVGSAKTTLVGTTAWCSPEVLKGAAPDDKNDVFSYGVILWEIAARALPYASLRFEYQVADFVCSEQRMEVPPYCFPPWAQLMQTCWAHAPADRPAIAGCLQDLIRMSRRLAERGPAEVDYATLSPPNVRKHNVLWVDDKGRERGLMIGMWEKQRPDINFLPFDGTAALKAWMKRHEDEIMFRGGDLALRVITNRYREKDGGDLAAENLIGWLRNTADCPFPKTLALVYCSNTQPLLHLKSRSTYLSSIATFAQRFALFEALPVDEAATASPSPRLP